MTTFAIDPHDSGAIQLHPNVVDTAVMHLPGEGTLRINPPALRRPRAGTGRHDTGEQPLFPTGAELAVWGPQWGAHAVAPFQEPPTGPKPQLPPQPPAPPKGYAPPVVPGRDAEDWPTAVVLLDDSGKPVTKPLFRRGAHRHPRRSVDWLDVTGTLAIAVAGGYVGGTAAQMWQVPW